VEELVKSSYQTLKSIRVMPKNMCNNCPSRRIE